MWTRAEKYYWCLKHDTVEPRKGCKNADRLGPYDSQVEASHALERVAERNKEWENDPNWNDSLSDDES